jgi:hypothetical protein
MEFTNFYLGGEGEIRTPAPTKRRPTGLANPPLQPLGYLSKSPIMSNILSYFK